jgi:hypothetical protein
MTGRIISGTIVLAMVALAAAALPDLVRYFKIR